MKRQLLFMLFFLTSILIAMDEAPSGKRKFEDSESSEQRSAKVPAGAVPKLFEQSSEQQTFKKFATFPQEIQTAINTATSAEQAGDRLREIAGKDSALKAFINDLDVKTGKEKPGTNAILIDVIAYRFTNGDRQKAAQALGTDAAQKWLAAHSLSGIPADLKKMIIQIIIENSEWQSQQPLQALASTNKAIYQLLQNPQAVREIIKEVVTVSEKNTIKAAYAIPTKVTQTIKKIDTILAGAVDVKGEEFDKALELLKNMPLEDIKLYANDLLLRGIYTYAVLTGNDQYRAFSPIDTYAGFKQFYKFLLPYVDVNRVSGDYNFFAGPHITLLTAALKEGLYDLTERLLKLGADANVRGYENKTPLQMSRRPLNTQYLYQPKMQELEKLLKEHGAVEAPDLSQEELSSEVESE